MHVEQNLFGVVFMADAASTSEEPKPTRRGAYTESEMLDMLVGYMNLDPSLWDHIPVGAHVRYVKRTGGKTREARFKPGSFVKNHFELQGKKMLLLETSTTGPRKVFPVAYEDIEELWKKYDRGAYIEIHLTRISLAEKQRRIDALETEIKALRTDVNGIKDLLLRMAQSHQ